MAKNFNLTAEINLRGPANIKAVVADIKRQLGSFNSNVNLKIDPAASKNISNITKQIQAMSSAISAAQKNTQSLSSSLKSLSTSLSSVQSVSSGSSTGLKNTAQSATAVAKAAKQASSRMEEFGKQSALAIKRFAAFSVVTTGVYALINAITSGTKAFIEFDREIIRLQQVTGKSRAGLGDLIDEVTRLSTNLGVSSASLIEVASTLAQAGFNARDTQIALEALAKTELAPSFDNLKDTTEGAIAALRQFGLQTNQLESALGSINAVAAAFAVESSDIISAIQRTGGVFAASSRGVSEGTDALNEFIAVFTSVRATTRESAETIATGLRTIFTRIQRAQTIEQLKAFGVELTDLEGKFVGPFEATRRLSEALNQLDPRDIRFATIVEELGGFRQIGKVIPLIQQFATAQEALKVAQRGQDSLTSAQVIAQQSLANQLAKVREQFLALIRDIGQSKAFQNLFKLVINLSSGLVGLVGAFKPILPLLSLLAAVKGLGAITKFTGGFLGALGSSGAKDTGRNIGSSITGTKEKDRVEATARAVDALRSNTDAIKNLTLSVDALNSTMKSSGSSDIGSVRKFAKGGFVPGSGNRDTVPAMLTPGEFVIRKKAVETIGADKLHKMNKYAYGGKVSDLSRYYKSIPTKKGYENLENQPIKDNSIFKEVKPTDLTTDQIEEWRGSDVPRWKKFEYVLSKNYNLGPPASEQFALLDFPQSRSEAKFMKKGDTYDDPDSIKGNNEATIAAKNFLYENSLLSGTANLNPDELITRAIANKPVTAYWADPAKFAAQGLNKGGLIQKFLRGGTVEETATLENMSVEDSLMAWLKELGGIQGVKDISGIAGNDRTLDSALRVNNIKSGGAKLQTAIQAINKALSNKTAKKAREAQSINKAIKLAIVGLEPLGLNEDRIFDTGFGKAALLLRGLPNDPMYADLVPQMRAGVGQLSTNLATGLQAATAFGGNQPIALDFDETLVKGADIFGPDGKPDIPAYDDLNKVKEALKNGQPTELAQKLKSILDFDPSFIDRIRVLTARPQESANLLAEKLNSIGLPIPASKIQGTRGGGSTKASKLGVVEKLIDDNYDNILAAIAQGKTAKQYAELREVQDAEQRAGGIANAEGAILQLALSKLGAQGGIIKEAAIDFEKGLGLQASQVFGLPPDIPTEVKRTLSSAAIGRAEEEFKRYFNENYGPFNKGSDVYSISKTTGLPVSRFAEGGEVYSLEQLVSLGKYRGDYSEGINRYLSNKSDFMKWAENKGLSEEIIQDTIETSNQLLNMFKSKESLRASSRNNKLYSGIKGGKLKIILNQIGTPLNNDKDIANAIGKTFNLGGSLLSTSESYDTASSFTDAPDKSSAIMTILRKKGSPSVDVDQAIYDTSTEREVLMALADYRDRGTGETGADILSYARQKVRTEREFLLPPDAKFRIEDIDKIYSKDREDKILGGNIRHIEGMKVQQLKDGGKAFGKTNEFEKIKQKILDQYPNINFRISKRKGGFGYNILGGLKQEGSNIGNYAEFKQASNLSKLQEVADNMASSLLYEYGPNIDPSLLKNMRNKRKFAKGGSAQDTVPALLTPGEFVINKKAAQKIGYSKLHKLNKADKLQGYNKGGIVDGIQRFVVGGEAKKNVARAQGTVLTDIKQAEKAFAIGLGPLGKNIKDLILKQFKGIEAVAAGQKTSLGTQFKEQTRGQVAFGQSGSSVMGLQIQGKKVQATTETVMHETGHLADFALGGKKAYASKTAGTFQFDLVEKVKPIMEKAFKESGIKSKKMLDYLTSNEELFAEFFAKASPEVRAIITSTTDAKIGMQKLKEHLEKVGHTFAGLEASDIDIGNQNQATGAATQAQTTQASNAQNNALLLAAERLEFFAYKAKQAGLTVEQYQRKLARETSQLAKDLQKDLKAKQVDLKYSIVNNQAGLRGRSRGGTDEDKSFIRKAEETILSKLTAINPDPAVLKDLEVAAAKTVDEMLKAGATFDSISSTVSEVADAMKKPLNASEALGEALVIMAERTGVAVDILEEQIADRAERMQTTTGNIIAGLEEVVDGLGGPIRVVGIAMTIVGDQIRRLVTSLDSNTRQNATLMGIMGGFIGAAQGMVAGQVLGSEGGRLLERIFPNVEGLGRRFELAATVTGTLIGAINGAADAYHRAQLDKTLNSIAESGRKVDLAFENLAKNNTPEAFKQAQDALLEGANNFVSLADQANFGAGGTSRTTLEWMRGLDPTGITASVSGQATEQEARDQFINAISGQVERARQLGDIRMTRVRGEDVTRSVGRMQEFDKQIQEQRAAGNEGAVKAIQEERTKFLSTSSQVFGQLRQIYKTDSDAFLALYTEQAQRSGKTAQQISDAIKTPEGLENAIKEGQRISAMYAEQEQRARLLSDAMRNVAVQTENVINTYRMIGAALDRFGQSIEQIKDDAINAAAAFRGEAKIGKVKRTDEEIFGNISGFSMQEVGGAAARAGRLAGGGKFGTQLEQRIVGAKALQDELPRILQGITAQNADEAIDQLSAKFKEMNIELDPALLKELENTLRQRLTGQKEGTTVAELASDPELLNNLSKVGEAALKVASQLSKTFYDAFQGVIDLTNEYGKALEQATEWQLKAADIRAKADIQLADALGESLSLDELNAPIDARIRSLSSSSVLPGGSTDTEKLAKSIKDLAAQRQIAEADLAEKLLAVQSAQTDEERIKAKQAVDDQVRFMAEQNQQINNTTKALEELANDSSAASNALQKLQDFRATTKAGVNLAQKVLTAEPEELLNINKQLAAYNKTITGQATPRDMANVQFRQQAFGGLDMLRSVMPEKIAQQMQARMSRQMLTSMGVDLGQTIAIGPDNQQISLDQALTNVETGTDPQQQAYIDAYRAATERQAAAADKLGEAAIVVASTFTDAATKITEQLINNLPQTVQQTAKEAEPPPKPEEQPKPEDKAAEPLVVNIVPDEKQISILDTIKNQGLESTRQIVEAIGALSTSLVTAIGTMFAQSAIDSIVDRTIGNLSGRIFGGRGGGGAMDMGRLATAGRSAGTGAAQAAGTAGRAAGAAGTAAGGAGMAGTASSVATGAGAIYGGYVLTDWIFSVGELVTDFDNKMAEIGDRAQKQAGKSYISQVIQNLAEPGDALIQLFSEIGQIGSYAAKEIGKQIGIVKNELALADKRLREIRAKDAGADAVNYNELGVVAQTRAKFQAEAQLSLNKAQKIKASGGSAEDVSKAVGFNIGGSIDKFIELQQSKIADYMKLEGGDTYNKAVTELLSKMEQDNAKMGQMADEATKPGSIYTHDTHCEKVLYEILSVLSGKKVDQPVTRQQISEGVGSTAPATPGPAKKTIPPGGMVAAASPDAQRTTQDPNALRMVPKSTTTNEDIRRSKDPVIPSTMRAKQEQQRLDELKKKGAYRISNSGLPMGRSYEEQGEYQKLQAKYRSPYEQAKLARRQAYLNRFRPEVRERMLNEDEKAKQRYASTTNQKIQPNISQNTSPIPANKPSQTIKNEQPITENKNNQNSNPIYTYDIKVESAINTLIQFLRDSQSVGNTTSVPPNQSNKQISTPQIEKSIYTLSIDEQTNKFLNNLTSTINTFGNYITQLESVSSKIPSKIDLVLVAEPVDVNVKFTGAAVIEELKRSPQAIKDLVDKEVVNNLDNKIKTIQKWIKDVSGSDLSPGV